MPEQAFDAVVIGAGSGGLTAAIGLAGFGRRVALVEGDRVGGECTNTGCIPSKRLLHLARHGGDPGDHLRRVRATRDLIRDEELAELAHNPLITLIEGRAALDAARRVRVEDTVLSARHVIVATGSRAREIEIPGLPPERTLTNASLFELEHAPDHLAIVGAGAIGLEMADAFVRLGSRVTLVDMAPRVLPPAPAAASDAVARALERRGVATHLGCRTTGYDADARSLSLADDTGVRVVDDVDAVLVAVGRTPNTDGLGLEEAGVVTTPDGIPVDRWGRTNVRGIWAVGDVTPGSRETHAANALGRRIVQRVALPWLPPFGAPPLIPHAVFTDPEVAWVGLGPDEAGARYRPDALVTIAVPIPGTDRGRTDDVSEGFVEITALRLTGRIVGATIVGPAASELIALVTLAMNGRTSLLRLSRQVYAYPTFAGVIGRVADEFARRTLGDLAGEARGYLANRFRRPTGRRP
ncbi:MAG: NAD(P)/FAD-dependent oxidoreductase [Thermoleophilia bacterium]